MDQLTGHNVIVNILAPTVVGSFKDLMIKDGLTGCPAMIHKALEVI